MFYIRTEHGKLKVAVLISPEAAWPLAANFSIFLNCYVYDYLYYINFSIFLYDYVYG